MHRYAEQKKKSEKRKKGENGKGEKGASAEVVQQPHTRVRRTHRHWNDHIPAIHSTGLEQASISLRVNSGDHTHTLALCLVRKENKFPIFAVNCGCIEQWKTFFIVCRVENLKWIGRYTPSSQSTQCELVYLCVPLSSPLVFSEWKDKSFPPREERMIFVKKKVERGKSERKKYSGTFQVCIASTYYLQSTVLLYEEKSVEWLH